MGPPSEPILDRCWVVFGWIFARSLLLAGDIGSLFGSIFVRHLFHFWVAFDIAFSFCLFFLFPMARFTYTRNPSARRWPIISFSIDGGSDAKFSNACVAAQPETCTICTLLIQYLAYTEPYVYYTARISYFAFTIPYLHYTLSVLYLTSTAAYLYRIAPVACLMCTTPYSYDI